jgi:hypothetical protein
MNSRLPGEISRWLKGRRSPNPHVGRGGFETRRARRSGLQLGGEHAIHERLHFRRAAEAAGCVRLGSGEAGANDGQTRQQQGSNSSFHIWAGAEILLDLLHEPIRPSERSLDFVRHSSAGIFDKDHTRAFRITTNKEGGVGLGQ